VYLTKSYKGATFGLSIVVPAIAGPYDLGTVVVRAAVALDTVHGQLSIATDALPTIVGGVPLRLRNVKVEVNRAGFLVNPTSCAAAAATGSVTSTGSESHAFSSALSFEGCGSLPFSPSVGVTPSTTQRDSRTSLAVELRLPGASAELKDAVVRLPAGFSLNPAGAKGLQACTEAELGVGTSNPVTCPAGSEVGTVEISTPLLSSPLAGKLYVGEPKAGAEPESGEEYRLFLDAENASYGISVRLVGALAANRASGQLTATFANAPPLPWTTMKLGLNGHGQPLFANSLACGSATTSTTLTPYSEGVPATPSASFTVDSNGSGGSCPAKPPFSPATSTSFSGKAAGANTNLTLNVARADGDQTLASIATKLPEGLVANLTSVKLCEEPKAAEGTCSEESKIGTASVEAGAGSEPLSLSGPVYLTKSYKGATFGLSIVVPAIAGPYDLGTVVVRAAVALDTVHGQLSITTDALPTIVGGVPLRLRNVKVEVNRAGFLVNPSVCTALPLTGSVTSTEGGSSPIESSVQMEGCGSLGFAPALSITPSTTRSDSPLGLTVAMRLPSGSAEMQSAAVTLPSGVSLNPAVASGLEACTDSQLGVGTGNPVGCPAASRVGTVEISTPLLSTALVGSIYIGQPLSQKPESGEEYRLFLAAENAADNISVRMIGQLAANAETGRLTATFANTPPLPWSELKLVLDSGARAPLASPEACGSASATSSLRASTGASATPGSSYTVDWNGEGGSCPPSEPFSPALGTTLPNGTAGAFDPATFSFTSADQQQNLGALAATLPPGMLADISSVPRCAEPAAAAGSCAAESRIGTATVSAGVGSEPLRLTGAVYLTGPYEGAPFGLSVVVPAVAGPYNLGTVVVRAKVAVNPENAQVTITSGALPTVLGGVPLRLKGVALAIERSGFLFNPTSCAAAGVAATITSAGGTAAAASSPLGLSGCTSLPFEPSVTARATIPGSREAGAGLTFELSYPGQGQANLSGVAATMPEALPVRLSTLHNACLEATFAANPAACPAAAKVGEATVTTPVLPDPMTGPAYLVATGGSAFPALDLVLEADGVRIVLHGQTDISSGVSSATFSGLPDVPVSHLVLNLPPGPDSLLSSNSNICETNLTMPTALSAQNGARIAARPTVAASACPSSGGEAGGPGGAGALSGLAISPSHFASAGSGASIASTGIAAKHARRGRSRAAAGATVSYRDSLAGNSTFTLERALAGEKRGSRCVVSKAGGTRGRRGRAGTGGRGGGRKGKARHRAAGCTVYVPVVVNRTIHGERHGKRCVARSRRRRGHAHGRACTVHVRASSFGRHDSAGINRFRFSGRLGEGKLAPGAYRLRDVAKYATGRASAPAYALFWILRG
ncbi:MAG: hypothetical protein KGJ43_01665, partial [Acidobacteriota bacterium]|nr:hypothetical protein [Acidobacteriota bacterium]